MAAILVCGSTVFTSCVKEDNPVTTDTTKKEVLYQWIADYAEVVTDESEGTLYDRVVKVYEFFNDGDVITVEPWRSAPSPLSRTVWLTATPSIRLSRQAATPPSVPVRLRMPTLS